MKKIEILGVGCPRCKKTEQEVRKVVESLGWKEGQDYVLEKILNPNDIAARGVMATPGVAVDDKIVSAGKIPGQKEITAWLK